MGPDTTASELQAFVERGHLGDGFVVEGEEQRLAGRVPLARLVTARTDQTARELCEPIGLCLGASDDLWSGFLAIENFVGYSVPVVVDSRSMRLLGVVTESDFISAYRHSVNDAREERADR